MSTGIVLLFLLVGCGNTSSSPGVVQKTPAKTGPTETGSPFPTDIATVANEVSTVNVNYGQLAAYAMLCALPAVVLYTLVSRYFVRGVSGGLKG